MKRFFLCLALLMMLTGCAQTPAPADSPREPVTLRIVTTYGGDDGNRPSFEAAVAEYEQLSGNIVRDYSHASNENWKARVMADFETGSEPDVLFFFTNADAYPLIRANKVVSLREIRQEYPDYAGNMDAEKLPRGPDGECYAVPITGYWESLYCNRAVLEQCGIAVPGADYTWDQFLADCTAIREAGFTPIACSLAEVAHYWFEFAVLNNGTAENHGEIPVLDASGNLLDNEAARKWIAGLEDIHLLYEQGFFPENTLTAGDAETVAMFGGGEAAFLLDGSWKVGFLTKHYPDRLNQFAVCHVPAKGSRAVSETIGGISTGFFITRKAWDDPQKREAAVRFVSHLTSDRVVRTFVTTENTALAGEIPSVTLDPLQQSAASVLASTTRLVGAVQDLLSGEARSSLLSNVQNVVSGKMTAHDAVETAIRLQ